MSEEKVQFKSIKRKNLRQRKNSSENEDDKDDVESVNLDLINETKEKQKLRERSHGVNAVSLAIGKKITIEEEVAVKDPFNSKSGGMVNMSALKSGKLKSQTDDAYDTGIGTQFSAETNIGDTDEQMMKYIDNELKKRKGLEVDNKESNSGKYLSPEEAALVALPIHLRESSSKKSEEMLSNQMLNGIPEIDLGIESKIKNIEATEEAKQKLLMDQKNKKDLPSAFVPKNYAVNFVQHNRCKFILKYLMKIRLTIFKFFSVNIDTSEQRKRQNEEDSQVISKMPKKATDDYHFDKFKKQFRRH